MHYPMPWAAYNATKDMWEPEASRASGKILKRFYIATVRPINYDDPLSLCFLKEAMGALSMDLDYLLY